MSRPQIEHGFIRIANELWDEILRRDFSKRQQNLILFIWRLSYGTGQKDCLIERYNMFELAGLHRSDVSKELKYLKETSVLIWDEKNMVFAINKDHNNWQISPKKNWDNDKFTSLIHSNLERKKVGKTPTINTKNVGEIPTGELGEVGKTPTKLQKGVGKTPTSELVKHQQRHPSNVDGAQGTGSLKTVLKTLKIKDNINNNNNPHAFFEENIAPLSPYVAEQITKWTERFPDDVVIFSMQLAVDANKRSMGYVNSVLKNWENDGVKNITDAKRSNSEFRNRFKDNHSGSYKTEVVPDWFNSRNKEQHTKPTANQEQGDVTEMQEILAKYQKVEG